MTLGVLGGTFDPIHNGHLAAAAAAQDALALESIVLVPSRIPPHRADPAGASSDHRYAMAQLAAGEHPGWTASRIEIDREGPSYTFDTLTALMSSKTMSELRGDASSDAAKRVEWQIFFIIGADAFAEIATWSRYPAVLDLAHFVVVSRPGITLDSLRERLPGLAERMTTSDRFERSRSSAPLSAEKRVILLDAPTPDISSTDIRRRVRAGLPLAGLVPGVVAAYISTHRLYLGR